MMIYDDMILMQCDVDDGYDNTWSNYLWLSIYPHCPRVLTNSYDTKSHRRLDRWP